MSNSKHIFLSYRSTEVEFALKLAADLKNAGVNLWMDRLDIKPGDDWLQTLQSAVNDCAAMISILSPEYVSSKYCQRELARADRMGRHIFPVLLHPIAASDWPFEVERKQYIDFSNWREEAEYRGNLERLVSILKEKAATQFSQIPDLETRYLNSLIADLEGRHGVLEYVELPTQTGSFVQNELRPRPRISEVWAMAGSFDVIEQCDESPRTQAQARRTTYHSIEETLDHFPRLILLGGPGTGKTTTIQHLALHAAHARQSAPREAPLPVLLRLAAWQDDLSLEDFIRSHWPLDGDPMRMFARGEAILFMDGLSEMGTHRALKAAQLREWLHAENAPKTVIVTCRATDYVAEIDLHLPTVQAVEMDRSRIRQFVSNYLGEETGHSLLENILPQAEADAENSRHVYQLAKNPFLLSILIFLHQNSPDGHLPQNMGALLQQLANALWEREKTRQFQNDVSLEELEAALTRLAFAMTDEDMPVYVSMGYAIDHLGGQFLLDAGISASFLETEGGNVRFTSQLMQDYFAALGLLKTGLPTRLSHPRFDESGKRIPQKWDKVIVALSGIVNDPSVVVRDVAEVDPYLALECAASGIEIDQSLVTRIIQQLSDLLFDSNSPTRVAAAQVMARVDFSAALPLLLDTMRNGTWDIRCEAARTLADIHVPPVPGLVQALGEIEHDVRRATATAIRQLGDVAVPVLLQLLKDENWALRRAAAWALGEIRDPAAAPGLVEKLSDEDNLVSTEAAIALGWIRDEASVPWLLEAMRRDNTRVSRAAADALGWIGAPAVTGLLEACQDENEGVRRLAIDALKSISEDGVEETILLATYDNSPEVRTSAIEALKNTEDPRAVKRLIELLADTTRSRFTKQRVSDVAARVLRRLGVAVPNENDRIGKPHRSSGQPVPAVPTAPVVQPRFTSSGPQHSAQNAKGRLITITREAPSTLPESNEDAHREAGSWIERRDNILSLSKAEPSIALPRLINALRDEDNQVRLAAIKVLSGIQTNEAAQALLHALSDEDYLVTDAAMVALREMKSVAVPNLIRATQSQNIDVRAASIMLLGEMADVSAVPALINSLNDTATRRLTNETIAEVAARALRTIGTPEALAAVERYHQVKSVPAATAAASDDPETAQLPLNLFDSQDAEVETQPRQILTELIEALYQNGWHERQNAAKALREYVRANSGSVEREQLARLSQLLDHDDWVVRWAGAEALAWTRDSSVVAKLTGLLRDRYWMVRVAVIRALDELGDRSAAAALVTALSDENNVVREAAAEALGKLGDSIVIPALSERLQDPERLVRLVAVEAMGKIGDVAAVPALAEAFHDVDVEVRWAAVEAAGILKTPDLVDGLIALLDDTSEPKWQDKRICDITADVLESIGGDRALQSVEAWRQAQSAVN